MAVGYGECIDGALPPHLYRVAVEEWGVKPWHLRRRKSRSKPWRQLKHRQERQRARHDPECHPRYNRYRGWET